MTYHNANILDAVRQLPCSECGKNGPSQAAHSNLLMHGKGKGIKASDAATFPLCHFCHAEFDNGKEMTKEQRYSLTMEYLAKTHIALIERGLVVA